VPPTWREARLASALAVPLSDRGSVVGVVAVGATRAQRFGDDELHFLGSLGNLLVATLQRAQTEEALAHSQRLESVGQLTGGIAHDFNNLLTVIQGNLQILEEHPALSADAWGLQLVGAATRASRRGAELTGKLLAFSRRQVLQPSRVDVNAMLHSLADMLRRTLDQRIRIDVDAAPDLPPCRVDAGQLESALLNIAINARDAMPEGGLLTFSSRLVESLPPELRADLEAGARVEDAWLAITVADTGSGMSEDIRERAFEPFFTTKEAGRGTGLGLSTVYGFVKQSKGAVAIETARGAGTSVTLYLPRVRSDESEPATDGAVAGEGVPPGLRVLLVEDEPEVRNVAASFLETLGCRVTSCPDAEQALALLADAGDFDLLLSDIALGPGMRGTELARRAVVHSPELAVLLMSGYSSELLLGADGNAEAVGWELLRKPFARSELARAIARVVGPAAAPR
jgi:signal transduction histidine kinase/CheY-like chemotaxis protein